MFPLTQAGIYLFRFTAISERVARKVLDAHSLPIDDSSVSSPAHDPNAHKFTASIYVHFSVRFASLRSTCRGRKLLARFSKFKCDDSLRIVSRNDFPNPISCIKILCIQNRIYWRLEWNLFHGLCSWNDKKNYERSHPFSVSSVCAGNEWRNSSRLSCSHHFTLSHPRTHLLQFCQEENRFVGEK